MSKKIFITGCAKSGTTLLLRMCYAFKDTEVIYKEGFEYFRTGYAAALTVVFLTLVILVTVVKSLFLEKKVKYT